LLIAAFLSRFSAWRGAALLGVTPRAACRAVALLLVPLGADWTVLDLGGDGTPS